MRFFASSSTKIMEKSTNHYFFQSQLKKDSFYRTRALSLPPEKRECFDNLRRDIVTSISPQLKDMTDGKFLIN